MKLAAERTPHHRAHRGHGLLAGLEHKIPYKYRREVPPALREDLVRVAEATDRLDQQMEQLHLDSRADEAHR